jgi:hypothetical protein
MIERVSTRSVVTLVLEHAAQTHSVTLGTTVQFVLVKMVLLGIRLQDAIQYRV